MGEPYDQRNLVTLSRFPIGAESVVRDASGPRPRYQMATAIPADTTADLLSWERPLLHCRIDLPDGAALHVVNVHLKSKIATDIPGQKLDNFTWRNVSAWAEGSFVSAMKRLGQALQARLLIDRLFDEAGEEAMIAILAISTRRPTRFPCVPSAVRSKRPAIRFTRPG